MSVVELFMDDSDVDEEANAVDPDNWEDRALLLMIAPVPAAALRVGKTGAVDVRARGPCADIRGAAITLVDMYGESRKSSSTSKMSLVVVEVACIRNSCNGEVWRWFQQLRVWKRYWPLRERRYVGAGGTTHAFD